MTENQKTAQHAHKAAKKKSAKKRAKKVAKKRIRKSESVTNTETTMGRPKIDIDWNKVDKLAKLQCTGEEIASVLGVSLDTLERRCKEAHFIEDEEDGGERKPVTLAVYLKQKALGGRVSIRRRQYLEAVKGNTTMLIWWGKNHLGQSDRTDMRHSGNIGITIAEDEDEL